MRALVGGCTCGQQALHSQRSAAGRGEGPPLLVLLGREQEQEQNQEQNRQLLLRNRELCRVV